MNRFENCNSLFDLYNVFVNVDGVEDYGTLTVDERLTVLNVFSSVKPDGVCTPDSPLSKAGYTLIWNSVVDAVETEMANDMFNKMEENKMMKTDEKIMNKVNAAMNTMLGAVSGARVCAGEDANEFKTNCDESITTIKDALGGVLEELDMLLGCSSLKNQLLGILYRDIEGKTSKRGFFDGAKECRRTIEREIQSILDWDPDETEFKQVVALRYIIGQDADGNPIKGHRSIFSAFANGVVWICKKVQRKLKKWFGVDASSNIFGAVGASIASVFGVAAGVISSVLKVAVNCVVFVGSYILSATLHAVAFVVEKIKGFFEKAKEKFSKSDEAQDAVEDELEDFFEEEC